jgi:hypothetical protein
MSQEELTEKFNETMHGLLGYNNGANWMILDESVIEAARATAAEFLKTSSGNFIATQWMSKITAFQNTKMTKKQVKVKAPSVFSPSPIEAAFARQEHASTLYKTKAEHNINLPGGKIGDDPAIQAIDDEEENEGPEDEEGSQDSEDKEENEEIDDEAEEIKNQDVGPPTATRKRALQHVSTLDVRQTVIAWMLGQSLATGDNNIVSRAVHNFPNHFRGSYKANVQKASRWWKNRHEIREKLENNIKSITSRQDSKRVKVQLKTFSGRGRRSAPWVLFLHSELVEEFERLRKAGVKFSAKLLKTLALNILDKSHGIYNRNYIDPVDNKPIYNKITPRWIEHFQVKHNIVMRCQTGKLLCSPEKKFQIETEIAYHLGQLKKKFDNGELEDNLIENMDETHFVINMDNGKTLGFRGDDDVKYADVVSGGESMTLVVRITGGVDAHIEAPMIIFQNPGRSYPIQGVADDIPGVCYRTGPKGWMDRTVFPQWLMERRAYQPDLYGRTKTVFLDNCGGHNSTPDLEAALDRTRTKLAFLPPCSTDLCQTADSFVISKIKDAWTSRWEQKKMELIDENAWSNASRKGSAGSGKLRNPGKKFFLRLAADAVRDVNLQRDSNGLTYARKAMIRCGLARDVTGFWREQQLTPQLQTIINNHRSYFEGELLPESIS